MEEHKELIARYNNNTANVDDLKQIESLLEDGQIVFSQLNDVSTIQQHLKEMDTPEPDGAMDAKFFTMLANQKRNVARSPINVISEWWASLWQVQMQWAYSLALVLIGGAAVYFLQNGSDEKFNQLTAEMGEMKELMMLTMLEQNSPTERLKAVSLTSGMDEASDKVATALIDVLRSDDNNSVRLAAIEALAMYTDDPAIRKDLIGSIQYQDSPLVQLALAELMVALKEKKSIKEFKPIIDSENTPDEVKDELKKAMQTLI